MTTKGPMHKPKQLLMFGSGEELPLFSGTPQTDRSEPFVQKPYEQQLPLPSACPVCHGTGYAGKKFCSCEAGDEARLSQVPGYRERLARRGEAVK